MKNRKWIFGLPAAAATLCLNLVVFPLTLPRPAVAKDLAPPPASAAATAGRADPLVERGRYVAVLGGCHDCHTDGYAEAGGDVPAERWLTGKDVGFRGPWGVSYPTNLRLSVQLGHAQLALQRAWCLAPRGDAQALVASMQEFIDYAARDPERICPATAGLIHCLLVGNPGVAATFERFVLLAEQVRKPVARPWHLPLHAVDGWARVWRGDRAGAEAAMARASSIYRQFRGIRVMSERYAQFRTLLGGVSGNLEALDKVAAEMIAALQAPDLTAHRPVWERAYRHAHARMHWIHGSTAAWQKLSQPLLAPRSRVEWPFIDVAAQVVRGQRLLLAGDWRGAAAVLEAILGDYARLRLPMVYPDPRISLAFARLRSAGAAEAWRVFEPVYIEATEHHGVGVLLMDCRNHVAELLDAAPAEVRRSDPMQALKGVLQQWSPRAAEPVSTARPILAACRIQRAGRGRATLTSPSR
jgi:hypothetical protein